MLLWANSTDADLANTDQSSDDEMLVASSRQRVRTYLSLI